MFSVSEYITEKTKNAAESFTENNYLEIAVVLF
jgi:hypothetical protein